MKKLTDARDRVQQFLKFSREKTKEKLKDAKYWIPDAWDYVWTNLVFASNWIKNFWSKHIWNWLSWALLVVFSVAFILLILWQTVSGVRAGLTTDFANLFNVYTTTVGTIVAIFFSLALIPLNQIATRYSPRFLRFVRKDKFFWVVFACSAVTLAYNAIFLLLGASFQIALAATELFILQIILLGLSVLHVIKLSDPMNSILMPAHKEIVKTFRKWMPRYHKICVKQAKKNFRGKEARLTETVVGMCNFKVDDKITNYIQQELLPIREVALKAIRDLDLEQAKNALQVMMSVTVIYLHDRRKYQTSEDPLLYFLYAEFKQIAQSASNELKLKVHEFMAECWKQIGIRAAVIDVKSLGGIGENFNGLVIYPVLGLKEICSLNLLEMDSYAPGKACDALADIGVQLMIEGYDNQAASIVEELRLISITAEQHGIKNVSGSANYAIMRIYGAGIVNRNKGSLDPYNHPYRAINKEIDLLLTTFLQTKRDTFDNMLLSPLIGSYVDPFKGLNLSRISEYGLFGGDNLTKDSLRNNLSCVESNVRSLQVALRLTGTQDDWHFANQAIENIYRVVLNVLSYINPVMAKDHILFYKEHPFTDDELLKQAEDVIIQALTVLTDFIQERRGRHLFQNEHIHVLFSLYFIILYEYKYRPNESLKDLFDRTHEQLKVLLGGYAALPESDANDDLYKFYRLLVSILKENELEGLADDFSVPEFEYRNTGPFISHESQFPETMGMDHVWWILRPGFQRNAYYYNRVEEALKIDRTRFY